MIWCVARSRPPVMINYWSALRSGKPDDDDKA